MMGVKPFRTARKNAGNESLSPAGGEGGVRGLLRGRELFWKRDDDAACEVVGWDSWVHPLTLPSPPEGERDDGSEAPFRRAFHHGPRYG